MFLVLLVLNCSLRSWPAPPHPAHSAMQESGLHTAQITREAAITICLQHLGSSLSNPQYQLGDGKPICTIFQTTNAHAGTTIKPGYMCNPSSCRATHISSRLYLLWPRWMQISWREWLITEMVGCTTSPSICSTCLFNEAKSGRSVQMLRKSATVVGVSLQ